MIEKLKHYRKGTADENAMSQVRMYIRQMEERKLSVKGKVCLDVGAHIGSFSRYALDHGARRVISYEPHPKNFALLRKNCQEADIHNEALVSDGRKTTPLVVGPRHNPRVGTERFSTSRSTKRNILIATVKCADFKKALKGVQVIKLDAEGAEYDLFNAVDLPSSVEFIVGEFDCSGSFRLPDGSMTKSIGGKTNDYKPLWDLIKRIKSQGFSYHGPTNMRLPKQIFLIHVCFVRRK